MSKVYYQNIKVNKRAIGAKVESLIDNKVMTEIHNLYAKMMDPYVPFLEGPLSQTTEVTENGVKYTQPYAHYQYEGLEFNHTLDYHPLASAHWDEAMLRDRGDEFRKQVEDILKRRARELYG